jgi:gamma-glutamylcyclotransferase (GGCT)/AIG2-like uncharacterized protein YtfP
MLHHILVYGTLKSGHHNHVLLKDAQAEFVGNVRVPGYDLYHLGGYPGIRQNPQNKEGVECELYEIGENKDTLRRLDWLEGYVENQPDDSLFVRREIETTGPKGFTNAYIYEYGHDPSGRAKVIENGVW